MIAPVCFVVVVAPLVGATGAADEGLPFFTRPEPSLEAAFEALSADDPDVAIERIHEAEADDDDERAIVEFDVGQALIARARKDAKDAATQKDAQQKDGKAQAPAPPKLDDAIQSFERAAALAKNPRITSEAHLATGNAALEMQKLDDAIAAYRRAVVADLGNERARRNLQRALELKHQQPPPPEDQQQQSGDGKSDDQKQPDDAQKKDGEQGEQQQKQYGDTSGDDQQKKPQDPGDDQKSADDQKKDGDKKDGDKGDDAQDKKDGKDGKDKAGGASSSEAQQKKQEEQQKQAAAAAKKKPTSKEEAKRLLQGLRSRERPLSPLEMRGEEVQRAKDGKDW